MPPLTRRLLSIAGFALAVLLCLLALRLLASQVVTARLQTSAANREQALLLGQPLWSWRLRRPDDLVAGRAFGAASVRAENDGLSVRSTDGSPFELGLPLTQPVDPTFWPRLLLQGDFPAGASVSVVTRGPGAGAVCQAQAGPPLAARMKRWSLALDQLDGRRPDGARCALLGPLEMLRLRVHIPAGLDWHLRQVELKATTDKTPSALVDLQLPASPNEARARLDASLLTGGSPRMALAPSSSAETLLTLRDAIYRRWPGAIIQVGTTPRPSQPSMPNDPSWAWLILLAYMCTIGLSWRHPHARWQAGALCLAGPLWLITGQQLPSQAQPISWPPTLAFLFALAFALALAWRERPARWRWSGSVQAWLLAWVPAPLALLLIALWGHPLAAPPLRHILAYLIWAGLQQWLMLGVLLLRLEAIPRAMVLLLCAAVFALLHTPNGLLMQLCFGAELWWAACFARQRTLLPIALAHAACALLLEAGLAGGPLRSLEVSARFVS